MKTKAIIIIISVITACLLHAQQPFDVMFDRDGRAFTVPRFHNYNIEAPASSTVTYINNKSNAPELQLTDENNPQPSSLASLPANIHTLSSAYAPFFNPYTPMFTRMSPFALDFSEAGIVILHDNLALITHGQKATWNLLGGQTTISSNLAWQHNQLSIAGGVFIGNYYTPLNLSPANMGGINLDARYHFSDKFAVRGWGQYTVYGANGANNPWIYENPWMNYTGFGGAMEYMINESFGVGGGVEYRFNPIKGRLEPNPVVYPIFKSGSFKIGVR